MAAEASPCADAIARAEQQAALPASLLGAIALVESGRPDATGTVRPWPWTVNAEGHGRFYAFKQDAVAAVRELQARGIRSIDVGCLQVNLQHHPAAFPSLEQAFDPAVNAGYAARFLTELFAETGSWSSAVAWYHSRTPETGAGYRQLVSRAGSSGGTAPGFGADASPYRPGFLRERNAAERELARHRAAAAASRLAVAPAVGKAMYAQGGSVARAHGAGP